MVIEALVCQDLQLTVADGPYICSTSWRGGCGVVGADSAVAADNWAELGGGEGSLSSVSTAPEQLPFLPAEMERERGSIDGAVHLAVLSSCPACWAAGTGRHTSTQLVR